MFSNLFSTIFPYSQGNANRKETQSIAQELAEQREREAEHLLEQLVLEEQGDEDKKETAGIAREIEEQRRREEPQPQKTPAPSKGDAGKREQAPAGGRRRRKR